MMSSGVGGAQGLNQRLPAEVEYDVASEYCERSGGRLPKKAEWVVAAVGQHVSAYPWGNTIPDEGVCWRKPEGAPLCEVGASELDRNPQGVMDLVGNVREWTQLDKKPGGYHWVMGVVHDDCLVPGIAMLRYG